MASGMARLAARWMIWIAALAAWPALAVAEPAPPAPAPMRYVMLGTDVAIDVFPDGRAIMDGHVVATADRLNQLDGRVLATISARGVVTVQDRGRGQLTATTFDTPEGLHLTLTAERTVELGTGRHRRLIGQLTGDGKPPRNLLVIAYATAIPAKPTATRLRDQRTRGLVDQLQAAVKSKSTSKILALLAAPLRYELATWRDASCERRFHDTGTVAQAALPAFATCLLSLDIDREILVEDEPLEQLSSSEFVRFRTATTGRRLLSSIEIGLMGSMNGVEGDLGGTEDGTGPPPPPPPPPPARAKPAPGH